MPAPRYTIITPTILRPSLKRLCDSIDRQTDGDWEHIVQVDKPWETLTQKEWELRASIEHRNRRVKFCETNHKCVGNYCRHHAFKIATGEYILHIDDDDYYADDKVFETLRQVKGVWAIFPTLAYGKLCHHDPPGIHKTGSAMFMYRRDTGLSFDPVPDYEADGQLVEKLKAKYPYEALGQRPLVIYEQANGGRTQQQIDDGLQPATMWRWVKRPGFKPDKNGDLDWNAMYMREWI